MTVTTVVPGLMRTGSHLQAWFTGRRQQEFTWFALGASLPLVSMDAQRAARRIIEAVRGRRAEIILTPAGQIAARASGVLPGLTSAALHLAEQLLLPPPTAQRRGAVPGHELSPAINGQTFGWLTALGRAAARQLNQRQTRQTQSPR